MIDFFFVRQSPQITAIKILCIFLLFSCAGGTSDPTAEAQVVDAGIAESTGNNATYVGNPTTNTKNLVQFSLTESTADQGDDDAKPVDKSCVHIVEKDSTTHSMCMITPQSMDIGIFSMSLYECHDDTGTLASCKINEFQGANGEFSLYDGPIVNVELRKDQTSEFSGSITTIESDLTVTSLAIRVAYVDYILPNDEPEENSAGVIAELQGKLVRMCTLSDEIKTEKSLTNSRCGEGVMQGDVLFDIDGDGVPQFLDLEELKKGQLAETSTRSELYRNFNLISYGRVNVDTMSIMPSDVSATTLSAGSTYTFSISYSITRVVRFLDSELRATLDSTYSPKDDAGLFHATPVSSVTITQTTENVEQ